MTPEFFAKITGSAFGPGHRVTAEMTRSMAIQRQAFLTSCESAIKALRRELPGLSGDALRNSGDFYASTRARLVELAKQELGRSTKLQKAPGQLLSKTGFQQDWAVSQFANEFMNRFINSLLRGRV